MIIGYAISGQDNESFLCPDLQDNNIENCIDYIRSREKYITSNLKINKTKNDFSYTYDGAIIVSLRFKAFCEQNNFSNIKFFKLPNQKNLFLFKVYSIVEFDFKRRGVTFLEFNENIKEYHEVVGAYPVCLKMNKILRQGFYRTDLEFGRGYDKSPVIIVGVETFDKIKNEKFKGLDSRKILNKYDWEEN